MNDADLKRTFGELRQADRRKMPAPPIEALLRTSGTAPGSRRLSLLPLAAAVAGIAAFGLMHRAQPVPEASIANWTSPTASLLPGASTTSILSSVVNLEGDSI